jgi:hypothetical protein
MDEFEANLNAAVSRFVPSTGSPQPGQQASQQALQGLQAQLDMLSAAMQQLQVSWAALCSAARRVQAQPSSQHAHPVCGIGAACPSLLPAHAPNAPPPS